MTGMAWASNERTGSETGRDTPLCWCPDTMEQIRFPDESGALVCARCGGLVGAARWTDWMQRKQSQLRQFGLGKGRGSPLLAPWRRKRGG